jgi:outer membrane protein
MAVVGGLAVAALGGMAVAGEPTNVWTLGKCLRYGLGHSAVARQARLDVAVGDATIDQAWAAAFPRVESSARYTRLDRVEEIQLGEVKQELGVLDNYSVQITVEQLAYSGGRVGAGLRAARLGRELAAENQQDAETRLIRDIRVGYHRLALLRESVEVRKASAGQLTALAAQAEARFRSGTGSELESLAAKVRLGNEEPELIRASNAVATAAAHFERLLGWEGGGLALADGDGAEAPACPIEESVATALRQRPGLEALKRIVRLREEEMRVARSEVKPEVRLGAAGSGANSQGFVSLSDEWQWRWNAWLGLSWTLWDGGLTRHAVRAKRLEVEKARLAFEETARVVKLEVRTAHDEARRSDRAVAAAASNVALAERAMLIAKSRYDAGLATYLEVTDANVALSAARLSWLAARGDLAAAAAELDYICGTSKNDILGRLR